MSLLFANVTSFSSKAQAFLMRQQVHGWAAAETHIKQDGLSDTLRRLGDGHDFTVAHAVPSADSSKGSYGGVLMASRRHLAARPAFGSLSEGRVAVSDATDMAVRSFALQGGEILWASSYVRGGRLEPHVARIAQATRQGAQPFVWTADFNVSFEEVSRQPWLARLDAVAIWPDGSEVSCEQGALSRINFAVVSRQLAPYVSRCSFVLGVPLTPH